MTENKTQANKADTSNKSRSTLQRNTAFDNYMAKHWIIRESDLPETAPFASFTAIRRAKVSEAFPGKRLVIEAGELKQRANDTYYMFRPHTAFTHLTAWGAKTVPGAILVFEPVANGHDVTLYFMGPAGYDTDEFFSNGKVGEFWVGARPSLAQISAFLGIETKDISEFKAGDADVNQDDPELAEFLSELRLVKDQYEIDEMQTAVDATIRGFHEVAAQLQEATKETRGERLIEGVFHTRARLDGNWEGYSTIAACGANATTLHWIDNDGAAKNGDLLLLDAGIEVDSLYTADLTRTVPISGKFTDIQRKIYQAVLDAADAAFAVVKPGITFHEVHDAAMVVIKDRIQQWGLWPADAEEGINYHRRYMVHGTSHHLGIDVHDCNAARREMYYDGVLAEGMIFTIEPGLYFNVNDLTVPEEYRGIGIRIEDNVLVTKDGCRNLSAALPRKADEVEAWIQNALKS